MWLVTVFTDLRTGVIAGKHLVFLLAGAATFSFNANNLFLSGLFYVNDVVAWNNTSQNRTELFVGVGAHVYGDASNPSNWLGLQTAGLYRSVDGGSTLESY